jgi:hypothetical protein
VGKLVGLCSPSYDWLRKDGKSSFSGLISCCLLGDNNNSSSQFYLELLTYFLVLTTTFSSLVPLFLGKVFFFSNFCSWGE